MSIKESFIGKIRNHPEVPVLIALFALYMFLANYFVWSLAFQDSFLNVSGGSDPYFNYYLVQYTLSTHSQLLHTILLNYPVGTVNARPPFYMWSVVFAGYVFSPIFGLKMAAYYAFLESDAFYGALLIIPVYLMAKAIFGKKAGMFAAVLFTIMPGNLTSGVLTDGRAHTPELIFALFSIYFFEMAIITAKKGVIVKKLTDFRSYFSSIKSYYNENRIPTIYALMAAVSLGGLIVFWQGFPYIEVIILIYVAVQLLYNLMLKRPTGYLTYYSIIYVAASFPIGFYYYDLTHMLNPWFLPPLAMGLMVIGFGLLINIVARKPWIITIPSMVIVVVAALFVLSKTNPIILKELITGDGYFVKSRVYSTIAEAAALPLGEYISDFGPGVFLLGIAGFPYIIYRFLKDKKDGIFLILIFSIFSIFMSFEAARFNVTAAPVYAILGGGLIVYFINLIKKNESTKKIRHTGGRRSLRQRISGITAGFAVIVVLLLIIPSGMGAISAAVPENDAASLDHALNSTVPNGLRPNNPFGNYGLAVENNTQPLAESFIWLATQNANVSIQDRPAYVSWWDYGFQELEEGQHPTVAEDFQQGIAAGGQMILAQNVSQEISLFISRVLQTNGAFTGSQFNATVTATMDKYFGVNETKLLADMYANPLSSKYTQLLNTTAYGNHQINVTTTDNAMHALFMGQLSTKYNTTTLVSAYSALEKDTGSSISYIQIDHNLFPFSGDDPGIFYAPAYLTDTPSYTFEGEVVPTNYYQIYAETSTGAIEPLNQTSTTATITAYEILYTDAFYNTTIYKATYGYTPEDLGLSDLSELTDYYAPEPAFNMSNFELVYYSSAYNPAKNASTSASGWSLIPLQTAYKYQQEDKGTEILIPAGLEQEEDPIIEYYPGAVISGRVINPSGDGVAGVHVTINDQYGIPHETVTTNNEGYYNITGLPGNDSIVFSTGTVNSATLEGSTVIGTKNVTVTQNQANRIVNYNITVNYSIPRNTVHGYTKLDSLSSTSTIRTGNVTLYNSTYNVTYKAPVTNGLYSMNDILPYNYSATIVTNDIPYDNFTTVSISGAANQLDNLSVVMDNLTVSTSVDGGGLSGYNVYVNGTSDYHAVTGNSGSVSIPVMPGYYNITVKYNGTESKSSANITGYGVSKSVSLTPALSAEIYGKAYNNSKISFYFDGIMSDAENVTANATGYYNISMPYGIYTIYSNTSSDVYVNTINVTHNTVINLIGNYSKSEKYVITSNMNKAKDYSGIYELISVKNSTQNYTLLQYQYTNSSTPFSIYLPVTTVYSISGTGTYNGTTLAGFNISNPSAQTYVNIPFNSNLTNTVTTSANTTQGYITQGIMLVYSGSTPYYYSEISGGVATLYYKDSSSTMQVQSTFFHNGTIGITNTTYTAKQDMVNITQYIYNDSKLVRYNGTVTLSGLYNTYTFNMTNGIANDTIAEGLYYISISNKSAYIDPQITAIPVNSSSHQTFDVESNLYFSISLNTTTTSGHTSVVFNSTGIAVDATHLAEGNYTLYSFNSTVANMTTIKLDANYTYNPHYTQGYNLTITNNLNITTYYTMTNGTKIITSPESSNFTLTLHYAFLQNVTVNAFKNTTFNIYLQNADNITLTGYNKTIAVNTTGIVTGPSEMDISGAVTHYIYLPTNTTYNFELTNTTIISGVYINYTSSQSQFVNKSMTLNLTLHRQNVYKYKLTDPAVTGNIHTTVNTSINISNDGNMNSNLTLYSGNSTWKLVFSSNNFTLAPAKNIAIGVNITIPDAPYGNNSVPVMANVNGTDVFVGNITVYVNKTLNYTVSSTDYAAVNGTINMIPVNLINTGNVPITVNVSLLNKVNLSKDYSIDAYLVYNGKNVSSVTLPYNTTETVYIYAYGVNGTTLHPVTMKFYSYYNSTKSNTTSILPILPSATISSGSSGTNIINDYTANPVITIYIGIGIIVASLLAGIIGSSIRSRRRK